MKVEGRDFLNSVSKNVLFVPTHSSMLDPFIISSVLPFRFIFHPMTYLTSPRFMRIIFLAPYLWLVGCIPAKKKQSLAKSLNLALSILRIGGRLIIFPEGKLYKGGRPRKPRRGVAYLAAEAESVIVPVYVSQIGSLGLRKLWLGRPSMKVVFGKPFKLSDVTSRKPRSKSELANAAEKIMARTKRLK